MATMIRIDDTLYLNLDTVTRVAVDAEAENVVVSFGAGTFYDGSGGLPCADQITLWGKQGARLLRWLDAQASEAV